MQIKVSKPKNKILSCPCCGSEPTADMQLEMEGSSAYIRCRCGLEMRQWDDYNGYKALEKAVKAWNKRSKENNRLLQWRPERIKVKRS